MANKRIKRKKKTNSIKIGIVLIVLLAFISALFFYTLFLRSATTFTDEEVVIYIEVDKKEKSLVKKTLKQYIKPVEYTTFLALAEWTGYWNDIKPGRYAIKKNSGIYTIFRNLERGRQDPISITINKFRTTKDMARHVGKKLSCTETELMQYFGQNDSLLLHGVNKQTLMTLVIPNTYEVYWTMRPNEFVERMKKEQQQFWNKGRIQQAQKIGLSPDEVYTLASIIEEETNYHPEKPIMASVYLNRLKQGMALGADPTIKFALDNFSIKRITKVHISTSASSPYNTYRNKGLPPGPICTPSIVTIDAVLSAKKTSYVYFCAKEDFSGSHNFASTIEDHFLNARKYKQALNRLNIH